MRGFRAVYLGLFFNMRDHGDGEPRRGQDRQRPARLADVADAWCVCAVINIAFAATSGLWGVLVTDFIQFGIAMTGSFAAAYFALQQPEVGGLVGLFAQIDADDAAAAARFRRLGAGALGA